MRGASNLRTQWGRIQTNGKERACLNNIQSHSPLSQPFVKIARIYKNFQHWCTLYVSTSNKCHYCMTAVFGNLKVCWIFSRNYFLFFFFASMEYFNAYKSPLFVIWVESRLSKKFETFNIRSEPNFSNTKNIWFEHIWTLNFSIRSDLIRTSNISNTSDIFRVMSYKVQQYASFLIHTLGFFLVTSKKYLT